MYEKLVTGMKEFNWSKNLVHQMFFTIDDITLGRVLFQDPNPPSCNCYYDIGCPDWDCDESEGECDTENPNDDCGIMGNSDCTGYC